MMQMRFLAMFSIGLLSLASSASADIELPIRGGDGGSPFGPYVCPPGQWVVGVNGNAGAWVDYMRMICGDAAGNRQNDSHVMGNGGGGASTSATCPTGSAVYMIGFNTVDFHGTQIFNKVRIHCRRISGSSAETSSDLFGGDDGGRETKTNCGDNDLVVGFRGRHGLYLDAIGLTCRAR
jgi:hypothetical protein